MAGGETSHAGVRDRIELLAGERQRLVQEATELLTSWQSAFARGALPFYLAQLSGESLTLLRWRRMGSLPGLAGRRLELFDEATNLMGLPQETLSVILEFERRRVQLNHEYSMTCYELVRLEELRHRRRRISEVRKLVMDR